MYTGSETEPGGRKSPDNSCCSDIRGLTSPARKLFRSAFRQRLIFSGCDCQVQVPALRRCERTKGAPVFGIPQVALGGPPLFEPCPHLVEIPPRPSLVGLLHLRQRQFSGSL